MSSSQAVVERLRPLGPVFRAREAVGAGISWRDLYEARDTGVVIELSRGLYQLRESAGLDQIDFVAVCARAPRGMICLRSALAYWDLSDEIPDRVDLAVPSGTHRPRIDHPPTCVHVFLATTFDLGKIRVEDRHGVGFAITDIERTVVDCFRARHQVGDDLAVGGLRRYLRTMGAKPARALELASSLRVRTPVLQALRILQE
jgi:predicted transcriptional regulator of viral defense system